MSRYWAAAALVLALGPLAASRGPDSPVPPRREALAVVKLRNEVARLQEENKKLLAELAKLRGGAKGGKEGASALPKDKWDLSDIEKGFPLSFKSVLYAEKEAKVTLQYTGDGQRDFTEFYALRDGPDKDRFSFRFMDEEGVPLKTVYHDGYEGQLLALKKGDAFRLVVKLPEPAVWKRVVKVVVRDRAPPKKKP